MKKKKNPEITLPPTWQSDLTHEIASLAKASKEVDLMLR